MSEARGRERMVRASLGEPVDRPPVWLMRQAGRYLPEYREVRSRLSFLELCNDPAGAAEVSLQPFERFGMDGVVVFSDILLPLTGLSIELDFDPGPVIANPIRSAKDLERLRGEPGAAMQPTCAAIRMLRERLGPSAAVIGFAGAPWTLAAYGAGVQTLARYDRDHGALLRGSARCSTASSIAWPRWRRKPWFRRSRPARM